MIAARGLGRSFGSKRVLRDLDLDVADRDLLVVTGPNGSGKSTLLALCAGLLAPTRGELEVEVDRGRIGYLAHEPLVYRELTALENLDLYGRLYRVPERRERIGMLLERYGLWEARRERVATFSRGMQQRLALCRTLLHEPDLLLLDEPYAGLDEEGVGAPRRRAARARRSADAPARHARPGARRAARHRQARPRMSYLADVGTLAAQGPAARAALAGHGAGDAALRRLDARRLQLLALPAGASRRRRVRAPLGRRSSSRRSSASRARSPRSASSASSTGSSSHRRPERDLARQGDSPSSRSSPLAEVVALPAFALFFEPVSWELVAAVALASVGFAAVGTLLAAMAAASRARELLLPLLFLPLVIPIVVGGVGASIADDPAATSASSLSTT